MNRRKKFAAFLAAVAVSISGLGVALPAQAAPPVSRIFGVSRVETSVEIARRAFPSGAPVAYVASAQSLADALAAGSLTDGPVLLTDARALAAPVANYLASLRHAGLQKLSFWVARACLARRSNRPSPLPVLRPSVWRERIDARRLTSLPRGLFPAGRIEFM